MYIYRYLSANKQKWGDRCKVSMSECEFTLKDFDNDCIHTGGCWENIYKISKGKCKCILKRSGSDYVKGHEGDFYYNHFYKGKKKITKSRFHRLKKKLIGNSKNKKTYKYRKNTKKNRKSI